MKRTAAVLALSVLLVACGKDGTSPPQDGLSQDEAISLAEGLDGLTFAILGGLSYEPGSAAATAGPAFAFDTDFTVDRSVSATRGCPAGGTVSAEGTTHIEGTWGTGQRSVDIDFTKTPDACAFERGDVTLTVDGAPNVHVTGHMEKTGPGMQGSRTLEVVGGYAWSTSDGRSGTCTVDYTITHDMTDHTRTVEGTFCDWHFSHQGRFGG